MYSWGNDILFLLETVTQKTPKILDISAKMGIDIGLGVHDLSHASRKSYTVVALIYRTAKVNFFVTVWQ